MEALVHAADIQDRDGGVLLMATLFGMYPFLLKLYADAGYQGSKFQHGLAQICRAVNVEIVRRCDTGKFVVLPNVAEVDLTLLSADESQFAPSNPSRRLFKPGENGPYKG